MKNVMDLWWPDVYAMDKVTMVSRHAEMCTCYISVVQLRLNFVAS